MYTIEETSIITGLTSRTLRNYLKAGKLKGTKDRGIWQFTEDQITAFVSDPAVSSSIQARQNAIVYDFWAGFDNWPGELCLMLDRELTPQEAKKGADTFCRLIEGKEHIRFAYRYQKGTAHYIIKGEEETVKKIMAAFWG